MILNELDFVPENILERSDYIKFFWEFTIVKILKENIDSFELVEKLDDMQILKIVDKIGNEYKFSILKK